MPMPTRSASTPQSMRCLAWRFVTTFPPTTCKSGYSRLSHLTISCWNTLSPWLLSMMTASTPAATSARTRSLSEGRVPMAAATISCLLASFVALGWSRFFCRSFRDISATNCPCLETTGSLPLFDSFKIRLAASRSTPSFAVTRCSPLVIMELTGTVRSWTKSVSRLVTKPSKREPMRPSCVTGKPLKPLDSRSLSNSWTAIVGGMQTGSMMKPLS
mmetsp:Transcript_80899/g.247219  ORF Transcript_80899/g.247219 Transcript_80899/m.247219 type:complete len:216 (+) Transcript_80899:609-1256(+)